MPNWLKQTLHVVAIAAGVVATLPTMGLALPLWVIPVSTAIGLVAAKASPGADKPEAK
jgi:CRISPR/Cas system-associated protein Cas5 (RAMP superfamily)